LSTIGGGGWDRSLSATRGVGEPFYRDCSDPIITPEDADRPPDCARLHAAAQRSEHIELLGPPPFDLD
jgi:hypothetical protein